MEKELGKWGGGERMGGGKGGEKKRKKGLYNFRLQTKGKEAF